MVSEAGSMTAKLRRDVNRVSALYGVDFDLVVKLAVITKLSIGDLEGQFAAGKDIERIIRDNKYNLTAESALLLGEEYPIRGTCIYRTAF